MSARHAIDVVVSSAPARPRRAARARRAGWTGWTSSRSLRSVAVLAVVLAVWGLVVSPAGATTIVAGTMPIGSTTTVDSTVAGDVYQYTVDVPANLRLSFRAQPSANPSRVNVGVFANGVGSGLIAGADLGNRAGDPALLTASPSPAARTLYVQVRVVVPGQLPIDVGTISDIGPVPLAFGTDTPVTLTVPGQQATYTFEGIPGHRVGPTVISAFTPAQQLRVTLSGPGVLLTQLFTGGATVPGWVMQQGTYTLRVSTTTNATGSLTLRVDDVQDVTSAVGFDTNQTVNLSTVWTQSAQPFTRVPGAYLRVDVLSADLKFEDGSPGTAELSVGPSGSVGSTAGTIRSSTSTTTFGAAYPMNDAGTGTVIIRPAAGCTGTVTYRLTAVPENPVLPLTLGTATTVDLHPALATRRYALPLTGGQRYEVRVSGLALTGAVSYPPQLRLDLLGTAANSVAFLGNADPGQTFSTITTPPTSGDYVLQLDPTETAVGSATLLVRPVVDMVVPLTFGASTKATVAAPSDTVLFTYPGRPGGVLPSITVEGITLTDAAAAPALTYVIFEQDGAQVGSYQVLSTSDATGRTFGAPAGLDPLRPWQLRATVSQGVTGSLTLGLREPVATTRAVRLGVTTPVTFRAFGDTTALTFTPKADRHLIVERPGAAVPATVQLRTATGDSAGDPVFEQAGYAEYPLTTSAAPLTLAVGLDPQDPRVGSLGVVVREVKDPVYSPGPTARVSWAAAQNPRLVVDGVRNRRLVLDLSATTWSPADQPVTVSLVTPTGRAAVGPVMVGETPLLDLGVLSASGRYTIELDPQGRAAGSLLATVRQVTDLHRTVELKDATRVSFTQPGQFATLTVRVPEGLQVSWSATVGAGLSGSIALNGPSTGVFAASPLSPSGTFGTGPLTAGVYEVIIDPEGRSTGNLTLTLTASAP